MRVHPKSRPIFSEIPILGVLKKYFSTCQIDVDLSNNTNPFMGNLGNYPDLLQNDLKEYYWRLIASFNPPASYGRLDSKPMAPQILFTVGSSEGIDLLLRAFAEPNQDTIVVAEPSFPAYEHWGLLHNLTVKRVKLGGENYDQLDVQAIIKENPKLVFLCHPNNPTSTALNPEIIYQLCESIDGFVIVDEAYIEFSDLTSIIYDLPRFNNLIVLRTLSKAWGLAGVRCGAVIAADPLVINTLRYIQVPFGFASPSQEIVAERCRDPEKMQISWVKIKQERESLSKELSLLSVVKKVFPSQANFLLVELNGFSQVMDVLSHHKIQVVDCSSLIPDSIRVSIGTVAENQTFLETLRGISKNS